MQSIKIKKGIFHFVLVPIILLAMQSCISEILDEKYTSAPMDVFDEVWDEYDHSYGAFEAKHINWDSCKYIYRSKLNNYSTDNELYSTLCGLLSELHDGHVQLIANGYKIFYSKNIPLLYVDSKYYENASEVHLLFNLIETKYLLSYIDTNSFIFGTILVPGTTIYLRYIYLPSFDESSFPKNFINLAYKDFDMCDGLIIDLRFNGGGSIKVLGNFLKHFTDKKRTYLYSRVRNGADHSNFTPFIEHYMQPEGLLLTGKPIVVITNKLTASCAEHCVLALGSLPNVTVIGDTTFGALSTVVQKLAPNGWEYRTCPQVIYDTTRQLLCNEKGQYLDGIGITPEIYSINRLWEIYIGFDQVLETAVSLLQEKVK
jgi:hypothetical protein